MYYVYVLKSKKDGKLYVGSTSSLKKRLREHNDGKVESTGIKETIRDRMSGYLTLHQICQHKTRLMVNYSLTRYQLAALARIGQGYSPSRRTISY